MFFHLWVCPFTKVEESFNVQATHDLLFKKELDYFDHLEFPGVVPRTFIGPIVISFLTRWALVFPIPKLTFLFLTRLILGTLLVQSISYLYRSIRKVYGSRVASFFYLFTLCQFHTTFWMSRLLPNTFAFGLGF